jgi:folate-binding protein YgfZ
MGEAVYRVTFMSELNVDIEAEVAAAMNGAALVNRSSAGKIRVTGADRLDLLHRMSTNDLLKLSPYSAVGTVFTNDKGRIIDYVRVLVYPDSLLLITSPGQESNVKSWIEKYTIMEDIQLLVVTTEHVMYSVVGPQAMSGIRFSFPQGPRPDGLWVSDLDNVTCTLDFHNEFGVDRIDILSAHDHAPKLVSRLFQSNSATMRTMTERAYECYRIVNGIPREGCELIDSFNPYETNLRHAISFTKGCYIGQEVIARLDTYQKVQRRLVGLSFEQKPLKGDTPLPMSMDSEEIGVLTSASQYPLGGRFVGLGVVKKNKAIVGDLVEVGRQTSALQGIITRLFE